MAARALNSANPDEADACGRCGVAPRPIVERTNGPCAPSPFGPAAMALAPYQPVRPAAANRTQSSS